MNPNNTLLIQLRLDAEKGDAHSQNTLGEMYRRGRGVEQDHKQAMLWFQKAAEQGDMQAQRNLGRMFFNGSDVKHDYQLAAFWYQKAAEQSRAGAQSDLAELYLYGRGVEQNHKQAMFWYREAAEQGDEEAKKKLAEFVITPLSTSQQRIDKFIVQDGIATDTKTGLTWLRFTYGQRWQNGTDAGDVRLVNWKTALDVAMQFNQQGGYLGIIDWRLPNCVELKSLIDMIKGESGNYIDTDVFPNNYQAYWTSSSNAYDDIYNVWCVEFSEEADACATRRDNECAVRLVRGTTRI